MKKKLLSLLLVLCMVLPMVPVGVITAVAAEEDADTYLSKLETNGENWPVMSRNEDVALQQPGAWTLESGFTGGWGFAGYINGKVVTPQKGFDGQYATYGDWADGLLNLYYFNVYDPSADGLYGGVTRTAYGENFQNNGAGFTYQVPSTGMMTADVSFNVGGRYGWEIGYVGGVLYYSIVKVDSNGNTTVVYPAEGAEGAADVATEGAGMKYTGGAQQEEATFAVTEGDTLMFVFRAKTYNSDGWNYDFVNNFSATLSFVEPDSELSANGKNWPVISGTAGAYTLESDFTGGWGFAGYNDRIVTQIVPQEFDSLYATYGNWQPGRLNLADKSSGITRTGFGDHFQDFGAGFTYEVPSTGMMTADVSFNVGNISTVEAVYYSIVKKSGDVYTTVYPAAGAKGAADVKTEGAGMKYTSNGNQHEVATFAVAEGDTLMFLFRAEKYVGDWWSVDFASNFSAKLWCDESADIPDATLGSTLVTNGKNWPEITLNEGKTHGVDGDAWTLDKGFTGGWDFANYINGAITSQTRSFNTQYGGYTDWPYGYLDLTSAGGLAITQYDQNTPKGVGFTYQVTHDGMLTADVSFNVVSATDEYNPLGTVYYSIVKKDSNGNITTVYPTDSGSKAYTSNGEKTEKASFRVTEGDTLMFVFSAKNDCSAPAGGYWNPYFATGFSATLTYAEEVSVSAAVDVGASFAVNFVVSGGINAGIEIDPASKTEKILAKEMADAIKYRTYQVIDGKRVNGEWQTTSLAEILAAYADSSSGMPQDVADMAAALRHYGYAAANYFDHKDLPEETETELNNVTVDTSENAQKVEVSASLPDDVAPSYELIGATLVLEDELKLAFLVQTTKEGSAMSSEGLSLLVADEHGHQKALVGAKAFTEYAKGDGSQMLVSFVVPVSQYLELQHVTVLENGEEASNTVTYGVPTYIARMYEGGQGEEDNVLRAITKIAGTAPEFDGLVKATDFATFKYCGTWEQYGDIMISYWNESYVEVDFYGTSITPVFEYTGAYSRFYYSIDGGEYQKDGNGNPFYVTGGDFTISGLKEGKHTLRIKTNDGYDNVYFVGVKVDCPYALQKTENKEHYIQFVGDSISAAADSFARRVGDELGWDYATTALAGLALQKGHNNQRYGMEDAFFKYGIPQPGNTSIMEERYKNYDTDPSLNNTYATGYNPDIVFIFLGTNDTLDSEDEENNFVEAYLKFVANIKAVYGENTEIWVMQALKDETYATKRTESIKAAYDALKTKYGEKNDTTIHFIDCMAILNGEGISLEDVIDFDVDSVHPNSFGYTMLTKVIADMLDNGILDEDYSKEA